MGGQFVKPYQHLFWISVVLMPLTRVPPRAALHREAHGRYFSRPSQSRGTSMVVTVNRAPGHGHGLLVMAALYLVLVIGEFLTFYGQLYLTMMVAQYSLSDLRLALFERVEKLPMAFFDRTPIGRLVSRISTDIDAINDMFASGSLTIFIRFPDLAESRQ